MSTILAQAQKAIQHEGTLSRLPREQRESYVAGLAMSEARDLLRRIVYDERRWPLQSTRSTQVEVLAHELRHNTGLDGVGEAVKQLGPASVRAVLALFANAQPGRKVVEAKGA